MVTIKSILKYITILCNSLYFFMEYVLDTELKIWGHREGCGIL